LVDEIEPAVSDLISKAEQGLSSLQKKEANLHAKVRLINSVYPNRQCLTIALLD